MAKVLKRLSSKKIMNLSSKPKPPVEKLLFEIPSIDENNFNRAYNFVKTCITWLRENETIMKNRDIFKGEINLRVVELVKTMERQAIQNHFDIPKEEEPRCVAIVFREFFQQMKEPLITYSIYSSFIAANSHQDPNKKSKYLRSALSLLPKNNFLLLKTLCEFLSEVVLANASLAQEQQQPSSSSASSAARMALEDVAVAFGTALLRPKPEIRLLMITDAEHIAGVVSKLIEDNVLIFSNVEGTKPNSSFQYKMQRVYTTNALATLQELSEIKESEKINNQVFRSTLETLGDQLHKGDAKALQMLVSQQQGHQITTQKTRTSKKGAINRESNAGGALRLQVAKLKNSQAELKEPKLAREAPEELLRSDTEVLLNEEMSLIMKQIYGDDPNEDYLKKDAKRDYRDEEKEEMRKILTNIYLS